MNALLFCCSCLQPLMLPRQKCPFIMKKQEQKTPQRKLTICLSYVSKRLLEYLHIRSKLAIMKAAARC